MLSKLKSLFVKDETESLKNLAIEAVTDWLGYLREMDEYNPSPDQSLKAMYNKSSLEKASEVLKLSYAGNKEVSVQSLTVMHFIIDYQRLLAEKKPAPTRFLREMALKSYKELTGNDWYN